MRFGVCSAASVAPANRGRNTTSPSFCGMGRNSILMELLKPTVAKYVREPATSSAADEHVEAKEDGGDEEMECHFRGIIFFLPLCNDRSAQ